jgi:hypothetical protein
VYARGTVPQPRARRVQLVLRAFSLLSGFTSPAASPVPPAVQQGTSTDVHSPVAPRAGRVQVWGDCDPKAIFNSIIYIPTLKVW